jgi:hypothetical protein
MKIKQNLIYSVICIFLLLILNSCGYHIGSIAHPQIKTIAIAPIKNETYIPNAAEYMKQALSESFQKDASWKIKGIEEADCIMYARILDIKITATNISSNKSNSSITYMTSLFSMTVTLEFTVIIPGRSKPLVSTTQVSDTTQYQVPADLYTAQQSALQQACYTVAMDAVSATTEAW